MSTPFTTEPAPFEDWLKELKTLCAETGVTFITAVQTPNPHRQPVDIGSSWDPLIVTVDYMNILSPRES